MKIRILSDSHDNAERLRATLAQMDRTMDVAVGHARKKRKTDDPAPQTLGVRARRVFAGAARVVRMQMNGAVMHLDAEILLPHFLEKDIGELREREREPDRR